MSEARLENAKRELVGVLEHLAAEDKTVLDSIQGIEDDIKSLGTLLTRLPANILGLPDIQEVFAHLIDHVVGEVLGLADEHEPQEEEILEAGDNLMDVLGMRLEAKLPPGARHCEALENVFDGYWRDSQGDEDDPDGQGEPPEEEGAPEPEPRSFTDRGSPERKPLRHPGLPSAAEVTGDVELQGEE